MKDREMLTAGMAEGTDFTALIENIQDPIYRYDRHCRRTYVNPAVERLSGRSASELIAKTPIEIRLVPEDHAWRAMASIQQVFATGASDVLELPFLLPDGSTRWYQHLHLPEFASTGEVQTVLSIGRDVTEQVRLEKTLAAREREFRTLAENTPDVIVRYDKDLRRIYVNPAWAMANGIPVGDVLGKTPSEKAVRVAAVAADYEAKLRWVLETGQRLTFEIAWTNEADKTVLFEMQAVAEFDEQGIPSGVLTVARDISEHREVQRKLARREQDFRTLAENSPDTISRYNHECIRTYANQTFARLAGVHPKEIIGKRPSDYNPGPAALAYEAKIRQVFVSGEDCEWEYRWHDCKGSMIISHIRIVPERDETGRIVSVLAVGRDISHLRQIQSELEYMVRHDPLTGLPNRLHARERTEQAIAAARRNSKKVALLFVDLDNFKTINDSLGHPVGDAVLQAVAERLRSSMRESDTIGRQSGDEFLVCISEAADVEAVASVVGKIRDAFELPLAVGNRQLFASMSIGISLFPDDGDDFDTLLKLADTAMYDAKNAGRNTHSFFNNRMNQATIEQLRMHNDLKKSLANEEFQLHYQPQIEMGSGQIIGAEALLRWSHPELGAVPPGIFVPIAEANGLIVPIGEWVIHEACRQAADWQLRTNRPFPVAVNISSIQFRRSDLEKTVLAALEQSGLPPELLELELTESIMIHDVEHTLAVVNRLKARGVSISIDDFGTGYSSLAYLKRFDADRLKIDRSFVRDLRSDPDDAAIVRAVVEMAKSLGLATIAEGVEDRQTMEHLDELGCNAVQGYYFSAPLPANEFEEFCRQLTERGPKPLPWLKETPGESPAHFVGEISSDKGEGENCS
ncbi:MAG: EAL domain-containing protein [Desulfurivibrionaceae bacterium]